MQKLSTLADDLWPYLVGRVARVNRNGGGRVVSGGTGGSAPSGVDSFFELSDVEPSGWDDGEVPIWSTSAGKLVPGLITGGGGLTYTAGNGIAISGATISTKHKSGGGIVADSLGLYIVLNSESGLGLDTNGLRVGAGNGIDVQGDLTTVHLGIGSGLTFAGGGLVVAATLAGAGLGLSAGVMSVNVIEGIELSGDSLRVDEDYAFIWEASHRFNATPQLNANLNIIGADRTITSAAGIDLTIDLGVAAGGGKDADLILATPMTFRSFDFAEGIPIAGFSLFTNSGGDRQLTVNTIKSDSLHTRVFVADGVRIDLGEEYWGKSLGIVYADFFVPTLVGNTVYVYFEANPVIASGRPVGSLPSQAALFENNDWVLFKYIDWGTGLDYGYVWGQVSNYLEMGVDPVTGVKSQRWTFTFRHGDAGVLIKKGNVATDFGFAGQGYVHLSTLFDADGPWIKIGTWSGANPYTAGNTQIRTQMGNLAGISDTALNPSGYGFYSDNAYLHGKVRTAETIMDDEGLAFERQFLDGSLITDSSEFSRIAWWESLSDRTGQPPFEITGYKANGGLEIGVFNRLYITARTDEVDAAIMYLDAGSAAIHLDSRGTIQVGGLVRVQGNVIPELDISYDLGTTSLRWRNLYVDHLYVTGAISGDVLSGQEWEYPGSMTIDAHGSGNLLVTVTNQGTGRADLSVDRDIIVGGVVDGVDISAHDANPSAHHNLASAGDGISVASGQIISVDATVVRTPATVLRTTQVLLTDPPLTGGGQLGDSLTLRLLLAAVDPGLTAATGGLGVLLAATTPGLTLTGGLQVDGSVLRTTTHIDTTAPLAGGGPIGSGLTLSLTLATPSGLSTAGGLNVADTLAGAGLVIAGKIVAVGAGAGITVNADDVQIRLATASGLNTTSGLAVDATLAGNGLTLASGVMAVVAGDGTLTVAADDVRVNQGYAFAWTGAQTWAAAATFNGVPTFNSAPQVNANLNFIGGERNITSPAATNLNIIPGGDLVLNPGGLDVLPGGSGVINLGGYNRKWSTLYAAELYVETLVASNVMATIGGRVMITPTSSLIANFAIGATSIDLKHNSFTTNTWLYLENIVGVTPQSEAIKLTSGPTTITGGYRYNCTRGTGLPYLTGGPKNWVIGDAVVSLGAAVNDGYIDQASVQTIHSKIGPTITIYSRTAMTNWNSIAPVVTMGNLNGFSGYASSLYGFATGNDLTLSPATGFSGLAADATNGLRVFNTAYQLWSGANLILSLEKTNGLSIEFGSGLFNTIGWYEDLGTGTPTGQLATVGASRNTATFTELDLVTTAITGSFPNAAVRLRAVSAALSAYNLWLDSGGVYFGTGSASAAQPQTGGFITNAIQYFSGYVGVGVDVPTSMLHVVQPSTSDYALSAFNSNGVAGTFPVARFGATPSYALQLKHILSTLVVKHSYSVNNNGVDYPDMLVFDRGRIGMGTQNPDATLSILQSSASDYTLKAYNAAPGAGPNPVVSLGLGGAYSLNLQTLVGASLVKHSWGVFNNTTNYPDMLVFDRGNIGLGTQTPRTALDVGAGALSFDSNAATTLGNTIQGNQSSVWLFRSQYDHIVLQAGINDANSRTIQLRSGSSLVGLIVNNNGRISIGANTAASTTLHVFGTTTLEGTVSATGLLTASAGATISAGNLVVSTGYTGIGTTPTSMLDVLQPSAAAYALTAFNSSGAGGSVGVARFGYSATFALQLKHILSASLVKHSWSVNNNGTDYPDMLVLDRGNIGIGNSDPIGDLEVLSTSTSNANRGITSTQINTGAQASQFSFMKARGTRASKTTVANGDYIGVMFFDTFDGTNYLSTAAIAARVNGTVATASTPTDLIFATGAANNTSLTNEAMRITSGGNVGIGVSAPAATLEVVNRSTTVETSRFTTSGTVDLFSMFFRRSRGTAASPSGVLNGDFLGGIGFTGYTNTGWATPNSGSIELWAVEDFNTGVTGKAGADMYFRTKAAGAGSKVLPDITIGQAGNVSIPYILANAGAGTAVVVTTSGLLLKTSSSLRFKTDIRDVPEQYGEAFVMGLRPILYRSINGDSDRDWPGFAAEQVAELGGIPFVSYGQEGLVDSLHYERLTVPLVMTAQKHQRRIAELEARVEYLEMRLAA